MACGTPVAVSSSGGLPEVVQDNTSGLLCPPGETKAIAGRALTLLTDRAQWEAVSRQASVTALERFSAERIVSRYEAYYEKVLAGATE